MQRLPSTVADVMRRRVIHIRPDASVRELLELLVREGISGCLVREEGRRLVGTVSTTDLLWVMDRLIPSASESPESAPDADEFLDGRRVRDIMTPDVFGVEADRSLEELSRFFSRTGLHRAPVLQDGDLVGIVSISDLLGLLARGERET